MREQNVSEHEKKRVLFDSDDSSESSMNYGFMLCIMHAIIQYNLVHFRRNLYILFWQGMFFN